MRLVKTKHFVVLLKLLVLLQFLSAPPVVQAYQTPRPNPELLKKLWSARWISVPTADPFGYGVYHFRHTFDLYTPPPSSFVVHVTADNRYQLFVNGQRVVSGPARSDLSHWQGGRVGDTGCDWKCAVNQAYQPLYYTSAQMRGYFVTGPGDKVDGAHYPWGWEQLTFDDSAWSQPESNSRSNGAPRGIRDAPNRWELV